MTGSGDCGSTTSPIARQVSCPEISMCARWCSQSRNNDGDWSACALHGSPLGSADVGAINRQFLHMTIKHDVVEAIGNTPLIKLKQASEATGCTILGKAEFMNPGQSVKDRAGKWMILEAEKRGDLKPGGLVVEATRLE